MKNLVEICLGYFFFFYVIPKISNPHLDFYGMFEALKQVLINTALTLKTFSFPVWVSTICGLGGLVLATGFVMWCITQYYKDQQ